MNIYLIISNLLKSAGQCQCSFFERCLCDFGTDHWVLVDVLNINPFFISLLFFFHYYYRLWPSSGASLDANKEHRLVYLIDIQ